MKNKKNKILIVGLCVALLLLIYLIIKPSQLGDIDCEITKQSSGIAQISFSAQEGDKIRVDMNLVTKEGSLVVTLVNSEGSVLSVIDETNTTYTIKNDGNYSVEAEYSDFTGKIKVEVLK